MFDLREGRASAGDAAVYVGENSPMRLAEAIRVCSTIPPRGSAWAGWAERIRAHLGWQRSVEQLLQAYDVALAGRR